MIDHASYSFELKFFELGKWIVLQPDDRGLRALRNGTVRLELEPGISHDDAHRLMTDLNNHVRAVVHDGADPINADSSKTA